MRPNNGQYYKQALEQDFLVINRDGHMLGVDWSFDDLNVTTSCPHFFLPFVFGKDSL